MNKYILKENEKSSGSADHLCIVSEEMRAHKLDNSSWRLVKNKSPKIDSK